MNFDFEKTANGYEVVLDNAMTEHFYPEVPRGRAQPGKECLDSAHAAGRY